jgi:plastocyanin
VSWATARQSTRRHPAERRQRHPDHGCPGQADRQVELRDPAERHREAAERRLRRQPTTYKTPKNLQPGTYTYFCRVHPFMRGAFRVVPKKKIRG